MNVMLQFTLASISPTMQNSSQSFTTVHVPVKEGSSPNIVTFIFVAIRHHDFGRIILFD